MFENEIGTSVVDCAVKIHRETGPGLLESVYERILAHQLRQRGFLVETQVAIPIEYHEIKFDEDAYLSMLSGIKIYEAHGGIDFIKLKELCMSALD